MKENEALSQYSKERLTKKDLNDFSIKLNDLNEKVDESLEDYLDTKKQYNQKQTTKEQVKAKKEVYEKAKERYNKAIKIKAFKNNLDNINSIVNKMDENDPSYQKAKEEEKYAQQLYNDFKEVVRSRGKYGSLEKLNDIAVEVKNLSFSYDENGPLVLDDVSFKINKGEYVAIVGHNGSGKSTLSKILIGVITPNHGTVKMFGNLMTPQNVEKVRQFIGIVFQNPDNQFIGSTVQDDIAFGLENKRVDPKDMPGIILDAATRVGMQNYLDKEPLMLSGGQKQRVAIASTLALNPDIIIFDEATSMLDPKGKREIKEIMVDLKNEGHKTILSITHDMDEILNATKVLVMNQGKMIKFGTPDEVMKDKNFLRSAGLELPFYGMVEEALEKQGLTIKSGAKTLDELVDNICKIK